MRSKRRKRRRTRRRTRKRYSKRRRYQRGGNKSYKKRRKRSRRRRLIAIQKFTKRVSPRPLEKLKFNHIYLIKYTTPHFIGHPGLPGRASSMPISEDIKYKIGKFIYKVQRDPKNIQNNDRLQKLLPKDDSWGFGGTPVLFVFKEIEDFKGGIIWKDASTYQMRLDAKKRYPHQDRLIVLSGITWDKDVPHKDNGEFGNKPNHPVNEDHLKGKLGLPMQINHGQSYIEFFEK